MFTQNWQNFSQVQIFKHFKRKKIGTKVENVNDWDMGTERYLKFSARRSVQRSTWRHHHRLKKSLVGSLWNENCFWRQHYHIWAIFLGGEIKCKIWYPCSSPLHSEILLAFHISLKCSSWLAKRQPKILKQRIVKQMTKSRSQKKYYLEIHEYLDWS